jgi:hypothetical protein
MKNIDVFALGGNALSGEVICPHCGSYGALVHEEVPQWGDVHDDDALYRRPVSIVLNCHDCDSKFALTVSSHKGVISLSWVDATVNSKLHSK